MQKKDNWLSKIHFKDSVIICITALSLILFSSKSANAVLITYDMNYDAGTGITTLYNDTSSLTSLEFRSLLGSNAMQSFYLDPGDSVSIDGSGNISGVYWAKRPMDRITINKSGNGDATIHVPKDFRGTITVDSLPPVVFPSTNPSDYEINLPKGESAMAKSEYGKPRLFTDADITITSSDFSAIYGSTDWLSPDQYNVKLLSGSAQSVDDSDHFTTIFTANAATGCVPEPATISLLGIGALGMAYKHRRKVADVA
jgi:hypothetical protein